MSSTVVRGNAAEVALAGASVLRRRWEQAAEAEQVVGRADQCSRKLRPAAALEARVPNAAEGLHPAEDLFDQLPLSLTDALAGVPCRAGVDGRSSSSIARLRDVDRATIAHEVRGVVARVAVDRDAAVLRRVRVEHRDRRAALGVTIRLLDAVVDDEPVAILHQRVHRVARRSRLPRSRLEGRLLQPQQSGPAIHGRGSHDLRR